MWKMWLEGLFCMFSLNKNWNYEWIAWMVVNEVNSHFMVACEVVAGLVFLNDKD